MTKAKFTAAPKPAWFYSVAQVAERAGLAQRTIRRMIDAGQLPIHRLGRSIRVSEDDLTAFLCVRRTRQVVA